MGLFIKIVGGYALGSIISAGSILFLFTRDDPSGDAGLAGFALAIMALPAWPAVDLWLAHGFVQYHREQRGYRKAREARERTQQQPPPEAMASD